MSVHAQAVHEGRRTPLLYEGKPAARELPDPFGSPLVPKGKVRDGGSYEQRFKKIAVWNSVMTENDYLVKRWTEFLSA